MLGIYYIEKETHLIALTHVLTKHIAIASKGSRNLMNELCRRTIIYSRTVSMSRASSRWCGVGLPSFMLIMLRIYNVQQGVLLQD